LVSASFFALVHADDAERVREFHLERLANPLVSSPILFRCRDKQGDWHYLEASFNNLLREPSVLGIVVNARDVTERELFRERLTHQAFHDPLTGLPNRGLFMDRLEHALAGTGRGRPPVAVMFLDLDRFKVVNDSLGHAVGDALLSGVGKRLSDCMRPGDTVARLGGDEFAVLLDEMASPDDGIRVAERIIALFKQPLLLAGHEVFAATSIGLAVSNIRHNRPADLLQEADIALYAAKGAGRGCYAVFDSSMNASARERLDLETDLRRAVERDQLRLHYQPEMDVATGAIVAMEALVRWQHPRHGLMSPDQFIPLAEESGLILPVGQWVLREACRQAVEWQRSRAPEARLVMSVNLSARQLQQPDLLASVAGVLTETGMDPSQLRLEITETAAMQDVESTIAKLQSLKELGVGLAMDDFGTGYSSLSYLRRFAVDTVKVDRSFVRDLGSDAGTAAVVQAVTTLAHFLGMTVTAEGVETAEQLACASAVHCDRVQGYFCARPRTALEVGSDLRARDGQAPRSWLGIVEQRFEAELPARAR